MGQAASELQHVANQLQGMAQDEKKFIQAVFEGKVEEAKQALLDNPNVIFARTKDWYNAWHLAARAGNMEMLEMLGRHGKKGGPNRKPIPGEPMPYSAKSKKGQTPLMLACEEGNAEAMVALLSHGADVLDIDAYGNTCVHYAAYKGHVRVLEMLLGLDAASGRGDKAKRYTDLRNEAGLMPLHFAVWAGQRAAAQALVNAKCRLNATAHSDSLGMVTCNAGSTALHLAAMRGSLDMASFLMETWATMNAQPERKKPVKDPRTLTDTYGFTALQIAQNLFIASARRTVGQGENPQQASQTALLRLLDPITRVDAPQRDEAQFERTKGLLRAQSMRRSSGRDSMDASGGGAGSSGGGAEPLVAAGAELRPSYDGAADFEAGSPERGAAGGEVTADGSPGQSLSHELRARRKAEEEEAAARRAEADAVAAAKAAEDRAAAAAEAGLPPPKYVCPITMSVMDDPVTAADGNSYERSALEMWFELGNDEFPGSGVKITSMEFTPNPELKAEIAKWRAFKV